MAALQQAAAADVGLTLRAGDTYTDNVGLTSSSEQTDNILGVSGALRLLAQGTRYEASLNADLTYFHYANGTFDDQLRRGLMGDAKLYLLEDRIVWDTSESYGPVLADPLSEYGPENIRYDNYLTTGPTILIGQESRLHARLGLQYGRSDYGYGNTPDNQQFTGNLSIQMPVTATTDSSFNVLARRVDHDAADDPTFDVATFQMREAYLRFVRGSARSDLYLEAGASSVGESGEYSTTPLVRTGLARRVSPRVTLTSSIGMQYQDTLGRFRRLQEQIGAGTGVISDPRTEVIVSAAPMLDRFVDLSLEYEGLRVTSYAHASYNRVKVDGSTDPLSRQQYANAAVGLERRVTPRWSLLVSASYDFRHFGEIDRRDEDVLVLIGSSWKLQPKLDLVMQVYRRERHSNEPNADLKASFARLEIVYRPMSPAAAPRAQRGSQKGQQRSGATR